MSVILSGQHVLVINTKTSEQKCVRLPKHQKVFLKPFSFNPDSLIGQRFNHTYRVEKSQLCKVQEQPSLEEPVLNCDKTNEFIKDDGTVQSLSQDDIEGMKASGVAGEEIIRTLRENSSSFNQKTEFSKAKWLKKKMSKHQPGIIVRRPSIRLFCTSPTSKLRPDILGKIVSVGNVWSGSRVLVAETGDDLVTSAIAQRLDGEGCAVQIYEQRQPHCMFTVWLDLTAAQRAVVRYYPLKFLARMDPEWKEEEQKEENKVEEVVTELGKRKREQGVEDWNKYQPVCEELKEGKYDSLIISAHYDPFPVLELAWDILRASGKCVIHTEYLSQVVACANFVNSKGCSDLNVVDHWYREIQVLSGRTHPDMRMQIGGGFILSCTKLIPGIFEHDSAPIITAVPVIEKEQAPTNNGLTTENTE